jgi:hypothetical protein
MSHPENQETIRAELNACERAVAAGRYLEATRHLAQAASLGASPHEISQHGEAIRRAERARGHQNRSFGWVGPAIGILGYLLLSLQQPLEWTQPVWILAAFVLIPALVGVAIGRLQVRGKPAFAAFWTGMKTGCVVMGLYTAITLMVLVHRLARPDGGEQELPVILVVTVVYALLAGAVTGSASLVASGHGLGRR